MLSRLYYHNPATTPPRTRDSDTPPPSSTMAGKSQLRASLKSNKDLVEVVCQRVAARAPGLGDSYVLRAPAQLDHALLRELVLLNEDPAFHGATVILICRDWDTVLSASTVAPRLRVLVSSGCQWANGLHVGPRSPTAALTGRAPPPPRSPAHAHLRVCVLCAHLYSCTLVVDARWPQEARHWPGGLDGQVQGH